MENAYIKINGKEFEIPESLTFGQMYKLEQLGFNIENLEKSFKVFGDLVKILIVITNSKESDVVNAIDEYIAEGNDYTTLLTNCFNSLQNFFTKNHKN